MAQVPGGSPSPYFDPFGTTPAGPPGYPPGYAAGPPVDRGAQIREWLDIAYRGRWIILACIAVSTAAAVGYAISLPHQYAASTLVLVDTDPGSDLSSVLPSDASDALGGGSSRTLDNEVLVLQRSDVLLQRTADQLLAMAETPAGSGLTVVRDEDGTLLSADAVAQVLPRYLSAAPEGRDVDVVRITAVSTVPDEASLIANLYAQAYLDRTRESSRASMTATRDFLTAQVDSLGGELMSREEAVRAYMTREGAVRLDASADRLVTQLADLQAQRDEARIAANMRGSAAAALRSELADVEPRLAERLAAGTDADIAGVQEQLRTTQTQIETIYSRNPGLRNDPSGEAQLVRLLRQADTLRERARSLAQRSLREALSTGGVNPSGEGIERLVELRRRMVDQQIEQAGFDAQASTVTARMAEYESELSRIPTQAVELARLTRDRQITEQLSTALEARLQEATIAEQSELGYAEVISKARPNGIPFAPNRRRIAGLGLLLGLVSGMGLSLLRTRLDHSFHKPDDLRDRGHTVLGVIPDLAPILKADFDKAERVEVAGRQIETRLVALLSPMSQASESYRALRTSVQFSRPDAHVQTIVVTSPSPSEGKTTTIANLAVTLAQAGRRVLLVDADLRRPRQHGLFGVTKTPGVADALFAEAGVDVAPFSVADDLDLLPAGRPVPNPSEVLGSAVMRAHLAAWKEAYDIVLLDAPPILAATDAVLLSTQADAVIVVTRANQTKDFELDRALDALRSVGAPLIGVVLNGFDATKAYGYKYRYSYGYTQTYAYGHEKSDAEDAALV